MYHGVTFNFGSAKLCSLAIFETSFSYDKDIWIAATDYYMHFYIIVVFPLIVYLGFYVAFNTVQVISRRVVGRAEETSTYSSLGFCTVNCRPTASNYQLSHLRP